MTRDELYRWARKTSDMRKHLKKSHLAEQAEAVLELFAALEAAEDLYRQSLGQLEHDVVHEAARRYENGELSELAP